jgi:DNA-binding transcriptional ArsR family regulator
MSRDINSRNVANILGLLSNEIRIDILKLVYAEPRSFSDLLKHLSLESTSKLSFHLKKMEQLITKQGIDGLYELTDAGLEVYNLISAFENGSLLKNIVVEQSTSSWETIKHFLLEYSGALFITLIIGITLGSLLISIPIVIVSDILDKILGTPFLFEVSRYIPYFSFYLGPVVGAILYVFIKWRQWKEDS